MKRTLFLLTFFTISLLSCTQKGEKKENTTQAETDMETNLAENSHATQDEAIETSDEIITAKLMWEILMKAPIDKMLEDMLLTKEQLRKAKEEGYFDTGYGDIKNNYLQYDETDNNGVRKFITVACYPTDDGKKLITIVNAGGGIDIYATFMDQTYEYELATGRLTSIERPIEPYTIDEFYDKSFFTPKQYEAIQKSFSETSQYHFGEIDKDGYGVILGVSDYFETWEEFEECMDMTYKYREESGKIWIRRQWNGKRFVKIQEKVSENTPVASSQETLLIKSNSVDGVVIGEKIEDFIAKVQQRFTVKKEKIRMEGDDYDIYNVYEGKRKLYAVEPDFDKPDIIFRIWIHDSKCKTEEGIGVGSTFADIKSKYTIERITTENMFMIHVKEISISIIPDISNLPESLQIKPDKEKMPDNLPIKMIIL